MFHVKPRSAQSSSRDWRKKTAWLFHVKQRAREGARLTVLRSSPAAVNATGSRLVSVMPGATFTSSRCAAPDASTIRSVRERSRSPSAVRTGPRATFRHDRRQRVEHRVPALPVKLLERLDLRAPRLGGQVLAHRQLAEVGMAEDRRLRGEHELGPYCMWRKSPAHPQSGGNGFGEGAEVDDALGGVGAQRPHRLPIEAQQYIGIVLR